MRLAGAPPGRTRRAPSLSQSDWDGEAAYLDESGTDEGPLPAGRLRCGRRKLLVGDPRRCPYSSLPAKCFNKDAKRTSGLGLYCSKCSGAARDKSTRNP